MTHSVLSVRRNDTHPNTNRSRWASLRGSRQDAPRTVAAEVEVAAEEVAAAEEVPETTGMAYLRTRRLFDQAVALVLLIVCAPLLIAMIVAVRLTSRGAAIYTQRRVGWNGRIFTIYKVRSMCMDAEAGRGAVWCKPGDARVTSVGRFLRFTHLDELPQLVNILVGDMALIGPRPERPEIVEQLERQIPHYRERLNVLPGVTGLAQVTLPPDTNLDSVRRKTILDRQYVTVASFGLDLHILLCTVMMAFGLQRRLDAQLWEAFA